MITRQDEKQLLIIASNDRVSNEKVALSNVRLHVSKVCALHLNEIQVDEQLAPSYAN